MDYKCTILKQERPHSRTCKRRRERRWTDHYSDEERQRACFTSPIRSCSATSHEQLSLHINANKLARPHAHSRAAMLPHATPNMRACMEWSQHNDPLLLGIDMMASHAKPA